MRNMETKLGSSLNPNRDPFIESDLLEYFAPYGLTRRELDVLAWVPKGKTNNEIGLLLNISPKTVTQHLGNVYTKFGVESRVEALVRFFEILQQAGKLDKTG